MHKNPNWIWVVKERETVNWILHSLYEKQVARNSFMTLFCCCLQNYGWSDKLLGAIRRSASVERAAVRPPSQQQQRPTRLWCYCFNCNVADPIHQFSFQRQARHWSYHHTVYFLYIKNHSIRIKLGTPNLPNLTWSYSVTSPSFGTLLWLLGKGTVFENHLKCLIWIFQF